MTADEKAIRALIEKWVSSSATCEVSAMLSLLANDMVFIIPGRPPFGKKEFTAAWDEPMKGAKVEANAEVEEVFVSGDLGCTRTRLGVRIVMPDGSSSSAKGYTMTLFRRQSDGHWLFARDANLLTPEE